MRFIMAGAEVPSHRLLLLSSGVTAVGINFWRLTRRGIPKRGYDIAERYPDDVQVYLQAGTPKDLDEQGLLEFAADYQDFVVSNLDRISGFSEFDSEVLGHAWVTQQRGFWDETDDSKFWPVWHAEQGQGELDLLSKMYPHVAIGGTDIEKDTTLAGKTNALSNLYGTQFHALGVAKPDDLRQIRFATASTQAWLSPMMRGETVVWDGSRLRRYPKRMKDQARARYSQVIEQAGLDWSKIREDDSNEVSRLAIWSYLQLESRMDRRDTPFTVIEGGKSLGVSDRSPDRDDPGDAELAHYASDNGAVEVRNSESAVSRPVAVPRSPEEMMVLPVVRVENKTVTEPDEHGNVVIKDVPVIASSAGSVRMCSTCFVAANCPAFKPQSTCAFNLPVEIKTKEQLKALLTSIIEMQGTRVLFGKYAEELNGGYPDPNVSGEMDRLFKMVKALKDIEDNRDYISIQARTSTGGMLSSIFGEGAKRLGELPAGGLDADQTNRIIDGQ